LFIGNLAFGATEAIVGEAFAAHGTVNQVRLPTDIDSDIKKIKGFGYVTFASVEDAKTAYNAMLGAEICDRVIRLDYATPRANGDAYRGGRGGRGGGDRGGRGGGRGGRGGFGDRGRGRGGTRGGRGNSTNRGGFGDFKGKKMTF